MFVYILHKCELTINLSICCWFSPVGAMVAINQRTDSQKILLFNWSRPLLGKQTSDDSSVGLRRGGREGGQLVRGGKHS